MVDAIAAGGGLVAVAELAADATGGTVAIVAPAEGVAIIAPEAADARLSEVRRYVTDRLIGQPVRVPQALAAEAPIPAGAQSLGAVVLLGDGGALSPLAGELLRLAALLVVSALALDRAGAGLPAGGPALVRALRERPGADAAV